MQPTPDQQAILDCPHDVLVSAPPGTGKTTVALLKAARAAQSLDIHQKILFLTFSNSAVESITLTRLKVLGHALAGKLRITNFHEFSLELLQSYGGAVGFGSPLRIIDNITNMYLQKFEAGDIRSKGYITFDEFVPSLNQIFELNRSLKDVIASLYPLIIVDEFQDTDSHQWELIKRIGHNATIVCLGDPDQMIYEWRGASAKRFDELREWRPNAEDCPLDFDKNCHRFSSIKIIEVARLLRNDQPLPAWVSNPSEVVHLTGWYNKDHCKAKLIAFIRAARREGAKTIAILCRQNETARQVSRWLKDRTVGGQLAVSAPHWFQAPESIMEVGITILRSVALFIDAVVYNDPFRVPTALRWLSLVPTALSHRTPPARSRQSSETQLADMANGLLSGQPPQENFSDLLNNITQFTTSCLWPAQASADIFEALRNSPPIGRYIQEAEVLLGATLQELLNRFSTAGAALRIGYHIELVDRLATAYHAERSHGKPKPLTVMTMHQAKGREYDAVAIIYRAFGRLPSTPKEADAEARLYYTAVTRAKRRVLLLVQHRPRRS